MFIYRHRLKVGGSQGPPAQVLRFGLAAGVFVDEVKSMTSVIQLVRAVRLRRWSAVVLAVGTTAMVILGLVVGTPVAYAAQPSVGLGTATSFGVLAGTTVTNTGPSIISGDLGVSPGTAVTGFPPGLVINGSQHTADAVALRAKSDLTTGYNDAAGRTPATAVSSDLGGQTMAPGVYTAASALGLTGTVTLDAQNDPNAVFIFQAGSTLITASNSTVNLINGASPCNVFWQVGSSATLGTNTTFVGSILALSSTTVRTGTTVTGRVLARNGQVSLDTNTITRPTCTTPRTTPTSPGVGGPGVGGPGVGGPGVAGTGVAGTGVGGPGVGAVIPAGHQQTGAGGASHSSNSALVAVGGLALVGAGGAIRQAVRRRRMLPAQDGPGSELGGDE